MKRSLNTDDILFIKDNEVILIRSLASNSSLVLFAAPNDFGIDAYTIPSCDMENILKACWQENLPTDFKHVMLNANREAYFESRFTPSYFAICVTEEMKADKKKELVLRAVLYRIKELEKSAGLKNSKNTNNSTKVKEEYCEEELSM